MAHESYGVILNVLIRYVDQVLKYNSLGKIAPIVPEAQ